MNLSDSNCADFIVIGAGIAAASAGYWLSQRGRVLLLEREAHPGYHSTGRSAALFMESYGTPQVRGLTMASRAFLQEPPDGFASHPLVSPRGAMFVAAPGQAAQLDAHIAVLKSVTPNALVLDARDVLRTVPVFKPEKVIGGVLEPDAFDMDVHAIHQGFLNGIRSQGGRIICNAGVTALVRSQGVWNITAGDTTYQAPVVLNAAGAWAGQIGQLAGAMDIGLQPKRRAAFIFAPPDEIDTRAWPLTVGVDEDWYFKPDAGMLLGSPANADPVDPQDIQPEEIDIATGIYRIEDMTTMHIRRPTRIWAGLRSFVADGDLIGGFDPTCEGFFWVAAQGGYGIQTSPAMGRACAALACGAGLPADIAGFGLTAEMLAPGRLIT